MRLYKKIGIIVASIFLLALLGGYITVSNPPHWLINAVAVHIIKSSKLILEDGLHALLTGTGTPIADVRRSG